MVSTSFFSGLMRQMLHYLFMNISQRQFPAVFDINSI